MRYEYRESADGLSAYDTKEKTYFCIKSVVDEMNILNDFKGHKVEELKRENDRLRGLAAAKIQELFATRKECNLIKKQIKDIQEALK